MSISFIFFIVLHVLALVYFLEVMRRVRQRSKEYPLHDTPATLPFGFIRLRHVVTLYTLLYFLWVAVSIVFYLQWLGGGAPEIPPPTPSAIPLNL